MRFKLSGLTELWRGLWLLFTLFVCVSTYRFIYSDDIAQVKRELGTIQNSQTNQAALLINRKLSLVGTLIKLFKHELGLINPSPQNIEQAFVTMFEVYPDILQVRWIGMSGNEKIRIDQRHTGELISVQPTQLQNKWNRYYVKEGLNLRPDEVFISQIDLNIENGLVQLPHQPTLRAVMLAEQAELGRGLLVINFDLRSLVANLTALNEDNSNLLIAAGTNRWIVHPDPDRLWHPDLGLTGAGIAADEPALWARLSQHQELLGNVLGNRIYTALTLPSPYTGDNGLQPIYIVARTPEALLVEYRQRAKMTALMTALSVGLVGVAVLLLYVRYTVSLKNLNKALQLQRDKLRSSLAQQTTLIGELAESRKLSSLSVMVAGLAHELNTPVGATKLALSNQEILLKRLIEQKHAGLTKTAFDDYLTDSQLTMAQALKNNQRAIDLISTFKTLTFKRANDELCTFDACEQITDLLQSMKSIFKKHNADITNLCKTPVKLCGFPGAFSQIVQIIIINALEHAFDKTANATIEVDCAARNDDIVVIIGDNGKGIENTLIPKIFDPFFTTRRDDHHIGLGLHMAKLWIEQAFDGHIKVTKSHLGGAEFTLFFKQQILLPDSADLRNS
ncbi:sensor histidine kinase [Alteromonas gilva]|uniref:HAMP domain-containing sensor histidine kinase n=1 Tax=Alteromonas gilva TaxID=2987522 RepID=A0ABT5L8Q3_9ALTE|nr:HAMP domain-containing sensor histidine kinase [Alteromonas gilva]MDC8832327.1 HAMP domain-containing sensor histidine kinase [Alteromonas gilva]